MGDAYRMTMMDLEDNVKQLLVNGANRRTWYRVMRVWIYEIDLICQNTSYLIQPMEVSIQGSSIFNKSIPIVYISLSPDKVLPTIHPSNIGSNFNHITTQPVHVLFMMQKTHLG